MGMFFSGFFVLSTGSASVMDLRATFLHPVSRFVFFKIDKQLSLIHI